MKRHGNLYNKIITFENICEAYRKAALGRRYTYEVLSFRNNLEENLISIQEDLVTRTYSQDHTGRSPSTNQKSA